MAEKCLKREITKNKKSKNKNSKSNKYKYKVKINDFKYPIKKGSVVGKINVLLKDNKVSSSNLIVNDNIELLSYFDLFIRNIFDVIRGVFY